MADRTPRHGYPFETPKKLFKLRESQRRALRVLPDLLLKEGRLDLPDSTAPADVDRPAVEFALRRLAQTLLDTMSLQAVVVQCENEFLETRAREFIETHLEHWTAALEPVSAQLGEPLAREAQSALLDEADNVACFAVLAALADRVADDGYLDPRLA